MAPWVMNPHVMQETQEIWVQFLCQEYLLEKNGNPLQYSHLEHPMDRGASWATTQRVEKSWPRLMTKHSTLSLISNMTWDELTSLSPSFLIG